MGPGSSLRAVLDPQRLGLELLVFVEVSLHKTTPDAFRKFAEAVRRAPEVLECHMVAGGFDYLVKTRVADMGAYRRFLGEILLAIPGVKETRTYAVMEEVKSDGVLRCENRRGSACPNRMCRFARRFA